MSTLGGLLQAGERLLCEVMALIGRQSIKVERLHKIFRQAAPAALVQITEIGLTVCITLIGRQLVVVALLDQQFSM